MRLLLLTLLAVLACAEPAAADKDKKDQVPDGAVSVIRDSRITESSGLALSVRHSDLAYTINDRGTHPMVYAVQVSTGDVVGVTDVSGLAVEDTESIAVDAGGRLWLGDLGDNDHNRDNVSVIAFPEPGPGMHRVTAADRYGVRFPGGAVDVEGMLIEPSTEQVFLISKNRDGLGAIYRLPSLSPGSTVTAEDLEADAPRGVTDATFTNSGRWALLRTNDEVWVYDPTTWTPVGTIATPKLRQGESVTVERGDRSMLLGSEGKDSPIIRVAIPEPSKDARPIDLERSSAAGFDVTVKVWVAGLLALGVAAFLAVARRRGRL